MSHGGGEGGGILSEIGWLILILIVLFFVWYRFGGQQKYRENKEKVTPYIKIPTFEDIEKKSPQMQYNP